METKIYSKKSTAEVKKYKMISDETGFAFCFRTDNPVKYVGYTFSECVENQSELEKAMDICRTYSTKDGNPDGHL